MPLMRLVRRTEHAEKAVCICSGCNLQADTQLQDQEEGSLTCGQKANVLEALETHMNAVTVNK